MRDQSLLLTMALQMGAVFLGHLWGVAKHDPISSPEVFTAWALGAGMLMVIGVWESIVNKTPGKTYGRSLACMGVLAYSIGVVWTEPFLHVHQVGEIVRATLFLVPLLLMMGYLVRSRAWVSLAGVTVFVFTCSAMLAGNANTLRYWSGFLRW